MLTMINLVFSVIASSIAARLSLISVVDFALAGISSATYLAFAPHESMFLRIGRKMAQE